MTLPSERLKDWVILPSIVKLNENSEAPRMNPRAGQYSSKLELPDLNTRNWKNGHCFETKDTAGKSFASLFHQSKQQRRRNKSNHKLQGHHGSKDALEFVNIVNNPPTKLKLLSSTDVRVSNQAKSSVCGRWLEHVTKSVKGKSERKNEKDVGLPHFNSEDNELFVEYVDFSDEIASLGSVELRLLGNNEGNDDYKNCNDNLEVAQYKQDSIYHLLSEYGLENDKVNTLRKNTRPCKECLAKSLMGRYLDNYEYLITRQIELEKRQKKIVHFPSFRLHPKKPSFTTEGQYHMAINMREAQNTDGNKDKSPDRRCKTVCERCETKCKSSLDTKRSLSNEDILRTSTVKVYPFYETNWGEEGVQSTENMMYHSTSAQATESAIASSKESDVLRLCDELSVGKNAQSELKISKIELKCKKSETGVECSFKGQKNDGSMCKEIPCEDTTRSNENTSKQIFVEKNAINHAAVDVDENQTVPSIDFVDFKPADQLFLQTESYLLRLVANTERLTDKEIIRLIKNGDIDLQKFLIIKQLVPLYEKQWYKKGPNENKAKNPDSRVQKLMDFFDRLEKLSEKLTRENFNDHKESGAKRVVSDLVVLGFNSAGKFEKYGVKERVNRVKKKRRHFNSTCSKNRRVDTINDKKELQPRNIPTQGNMFVRAVTLLQHKDSKKSDFYQSRNLPRLARNISYEKEFAGNAVNTSNGLANLHRPVHRRRKDEEDIIIIANPPSSRNSFVSSFESISTVLAAQALPRKISHDLLFRMQTDVKSPNQETNQVFELLKEKVQFGLKNNFKLYPRLKNLLTIVRTEETCIAEMKAARDTKVDYVAHFNLVDKSRIEMYCKAFAIVDDDDDGEIAVESVCRAIAFVDSLMSVPKKYLLYTIKILDLELLSQMTIKIFCVVCTILERMVEGGTLISEAVESLCLVASQGKMIWYKNMFHEAVDFDRSYISLETVKLELFAGGMDENEEREITDRITTNDKRISFVDFVAYIPLFISIHEKICNNAFKLKLE